MTGNDLLTTEEAAALLKMHRDSIRRLIRNGKIPALLIGGEYRIKRADLEAMTAPTGGQQSRKRKSKS